MNKIFNVKWNAALQRYDVTSELTKGKSKSSCTNERSFIKKLTAKLSVMSAMIIALFNSSAYAANAIINDGTTGAYSDLNIITNVDNNNNSDAFGIYSKHIGGNINFKDGSINTSGLGAYAAVASDGGLMTLNGSTIHTSGKSAHGLYAARGSELTGNKLIISTLGSKSYAVYAEQNSKITINDSHIDADTGLVAGGQSTLTASNTQINSVNKGLYANAATIIGSKLTVSTSNNGGYAAMANQTSGKITLADSQLDTAGSNSYALYAANGQIDATNTLINTQGTGASALVAYGNGGHAAIILSNGAVNTSGNNAHGVNVSGAGNHIDIDKSKISTTGSGSIGAWTHSGSTLTITDTDISAQRSYALLADDSQSIINYDGGAVTSKGNTAAVFARAGGTINLKNATVNTNYTGIEGTSGTTLNAENVVINNNNTGATQNGVGVYGYSYSKINLNNVEINNTGVNQTGIQLSKGSTAKLNGVSINGLNNWDGIVLGDTTSLVGSNVHVNMSSDASSKSNAARGIFFTNDSSKKAVSLSQSKINVAGATSNAIYARAGTGSMNLANTEVTALDSNVINTGQSNSLTLNASGTRLSGKNLLVVGAGDDKSQTSNIILNGDMASQFNGDIIINRVATGSNALTLKNNSIWTGATSTLQNLSLNSGSQWDVTHDSAIDNLTLDNATLNMTAPGTGYSLVTVNNLSSNNGTLDFKTHLKDDASKTDQLLITGDYHGNTAVAVTNAGGTGAQTIDGIKLIEVAGKVEGNFTQAGRIVAGAYDYNLTRNGNKWLLESNTQSVPPVDPVKPIDPTKPIDPVKPVEPEKPGDAGMSGAGGSVEPEHPATRIIRPEAGSYVANQAAANTLFSQSWEDRAANTRYANVEAGNESSSLWLRNQVRHNRSKEGAGQLTTQGNRYIMQFGGDIAQWRSTAGDRLNVGVMAGYGNAQSTTQSNVTGYRTKAQLHGYSSGVYATWIQDKEDLTGAYVDSWMLYNWFDNAIKGDGIASESYKSRGITASVEGGYTFNIADISREKSIYLQPQLQTTWMGVRAKDVTEANGTHVSSSGNNNMQTRVGVRTFIDGKLAKVKPFIEANWIHNSETFGSNLNGVSVTQQGTHNLADVKVGLQSQINRNIDVWGSVGRQFGHQGYADTSALVGVKVSF